MNYSSKRLTAKSIEKNKRKKYKPASRNFPLGTGRKAYSLLISQAREKLINTTVITEKDVRDKMADNQKRIAEIDSQISRIIIDNNKRIAELDSQISQAQQTIKYQKIPPRWMVWSLISRPDLGLFPNRVKRKHC